MRVLVVERNEAFVGAATIFHHNGLAIESSLHEIELGIDVTRMFGTRQGDQSEFEEYEDARADHMQDEWKGSAGVMSATAKRSVSGYVSDR